MELIQDKYGLVETMNIYALKGHKVKVVEQTKNYGYDFQKEQVKKMLEIDKIYLVDYTRVHQSSSDVYLQEFPNVSFNSVNFVDVEKQDDELTKTHIDFKRYNRK